MRLAKIFSEIPYFFIPFMVNFVLIALVKWIGGERMVGEMKSPKLKRLEFVITDTVRWRRERKLVRLEFLL